MLLASSSPYLRQQKPSAVRALKSLILCTGHLEEYKAVGKKGCWKMLVSPEAISHLVGTLFTFSTAQLKLMFRQTNTYLCHSDIKVKTIGMAFFSEITDLMLKIIEALTHEEKTICQAAGVLLLSFLEERCMDMEEVPKILREIFHRLPNISEPATKQNTLKSVCHLASKWVKEVVDFLLERSPDCDQ
ncbi:hypothetical protein Chor_014991 [Crotalus horridus]